MHIISLVASNFKNLRAVEITPNGQNVMLTGANGAGKSAILDALFMALTGQKPDEPIRRGQKKGEITVNLGEITVKKVFTEKDSRLEILNNEGAIFRSPQQLLDKLIGELSFDPLAFQSMKPKDQRDMLMQLAKLDFSEIDKQRQQAYESRRMVNRDLEQTEGALKQMAEPAEGIPDEQVSVAELLVDVEHLTAKRDQYDRVYRAIQEDVAAIHKIDMEIGRLNTERERLVRQRNSWILPEQVTAEQIKEAQEKVAGAERLNANVRAKQQRAEIVKRLQAHRDETARYTEVIEKFDADKQAMLEGATYPLAGLSVSEDAVLYDGLPFAQLSTGQKIRISTAMAMALNPKLRVIFIRDGSLLDEDGLRAITEQAKEADYQCFIERVDSTGKVGIYVEAGEVKAVNV